MISSEYQRDAYKIRKKSPPKIKITSTGSQTSFVATTRKIIIIFMTLRKRSQCNYLMRIVSIAWHPEKAGCSRQKCDPTG